MHTAWLERRAANKSLKSTNNSNVTNRRIIKFQNFDKSKNEVIITPDERNIYKIYKEIPETYETTESIIKTTTSTPMVSFTQTSPFSTSSSSPSITTPSSMEQQSMEQTTSITSNNVQPLSDKRSKLRTNNNNNNKTKYKKIISKWGQWTKWSHCSRVCGGGVKSQSRECLNKQ